MVIYSNKLDVLFGSYDKALDEARRMLVDEGCESPSDAQCWDRIYDYLYDNDDIFHAEIERCDDKYFWLVVADIERWDGHHDGGKIFDSLDKAICAIGNGHDYLTITEDDGGTVTARGMHHDGTDTFTIMRVTEDGMDFYSRNYDDMTDRELHAEIREKYSEPARLAELFGWR